MKITIDNLKPGDLFSFCDETLNICLWSRPHPQMSTPKDTRVVVNFGFIELGSERFVIESYEWHDINVVNVL